MKVWTYCDYEQYIHTSDPELDGWRVKNHAGKEFFSMSLPPYPQQVSEGKTLRYTVSDDLISSDLSIVTQVFGPYLDSL